jgi:hypothetical protein
LPGAITAAEEVGQWAERSEFDIVRVVTDKQEDEPVTIARLRDILTDVLQDDGDKIDAFILHFAGHGFRIGAEQNLWLPTDWYTELRAISVEALRSKLYRHGIRNLTIFSDACRALPNDIEITELMPDGILGRGPYDAVPPVVDRYNAVMDGQQAFMVAGDRPEDARCVFSTAIIEGLWGHREDAFDRNLAGKVTPESLDLFLKKRLQEVSERYRLRCRPDNVPGTPRDHLIYFDRSQPPPGRLPPAPTWPEPIWERPTTPMGGAPNIDITDIARLREILGPDFGKANPSINKRIELENMPAAAKQAIDDLALAKVLAGRLQAQGASSEMAAWNIGRAQILVEAVVVENHKRKREDQIRRSFDFETRDRANLVVLGCPVVKVWSTNRVQTLNVDGAHGEYFVTPDRAVQVLIQFSDGIFASAVVYADLTTVLTRDDAGVIGWACFDTRVDRKTELAASVEAITKLQLGELTAAQVDDLAVVLRSSKHTNPMLGALATYLYDYSGDVDSIRRMAFFYVEKGQPMPFDVAFMGLIEVPQHPALAEVRVPAVQLRRPDLRGDPRWVSQATTEVSGLVVGKWPWFRQGWDYVIDPKVQDLARYLLPSPFTSFTREGGDLAVLMFKMGDEQ